MTVSCLLPFVVVAIIEIAVWYRDVWFSFYVFLSSLIQSVLTRRSTPTSIKNSSRRNVKTHLWKEQKIIMPMVKSLRFWEQHTGIFKERNHSLSFHTYTIQYTHTAIGLSLKLSPASNTQDTLFGDHGYTIWCLPTGHITHCWHTLTRGYSSKCSTARAKMPELFIWTGFIFRGSPMRSFFYSKWDVLKWERWRRAWM